jgi:hypothetical protein
MRYLTIDGMCSGTGIRDSVAGGYISPRELGLSDGLVARIDRWVKRYEQAHYIQFGDLKENESLDQEGIVISGLFIKEFPNAKVEYYSSAYMQKVTI